MTNSTVYILGAGFSKSFHPKVIPLMRDFLHTASELGMYEIDGRHRELSRLIYRYFGNTQYHDIEKVMSFLSPSTPDDPSLPLQNRQVLYDQFLSLINETLSWIHLQPPSKLVEDRYAKFAEHLVCSQSSVVSFNYDLLLDQLLYKTGHWIGYDGYGAEIPSAYHALPKPSRSTKDYSLPKDYHSTMYLLKPHGSINWGVATTDTGEHSTIYQTPSGCYHNGHIPNNPYVGPRPISGITVEPFNLPYKVKFKPFLVPPVLDKTTLLNTPTLRVIWDISREVIASANRLVFIGYSLPATDFAAEFLFRQGSKRGESKEVVVVSPEPSPILIDRYRDVFGERVDFHDGDTLDWFRDSGVIPPYPSTHSSSMRKV